MHELEKYVYKLQTLENHFKDFMSMPFSVIVDSKGNAMPLTIEALKNFIFQNLYKEWLNTRKALNMPILELDFKPLMNKVKALQYKASSETKAHLRIINDKTNSFLDSLQELKAQAKEIKLLPYNKPKENGAINEAINKVNGVGSVVDRPMQFNSLIAENMQKDMINPNDHYDVTNPKYDKYKEILKIPDFALSNNGKATKRAIENELKQRELIQEINKLNDKQKWDKFSDFMDKEREVLKALRIPLDYDETAINRFIDMGNAINDRELRLKYFDKITDYAFYNCGLDNNSIGYQAFKKAYDDLSLNIDKVAQSGGKGAEKEVSETTTLKTQRQETRIALKPYINQPIQNINDNTIAFINMQGVNEMISSKAIAQSVKNGFTPSQHIQAVNNVIDLFKHAVYKQTQDPRHIKEHVKAYRIYEASFKDEATAILSIQERKQWDNLIYFLKLEEIRPKDLKANGVNSNQSKGLKSKVDTEQTAETLPSLDFKADSTTKSTNIENNSLNANTQATNKQDLESKQTQALTDKQIESNTNKEVESKEATQSQKDYYQTADDVYHVAINNALDNTLPHEYLLSPNHAIERLKLFHKYYTQKGYPTPNDRSPKDIESMINSKVGKLSKQDLSDLAFYLHKNAEALKDNKHVKMDKRKIKPSHILYELAKQSEKEIKQEADTLINNLLEKYNIPYLHTKRNRVGDYDIPYLNSSLGYNLRDLAYKEAQNELAPLHKLELAYLQNLKHKDFMNTDSNMRKFVNEANVFNQKYLINKVKEMLEKGLDDEAIKQYSKDFVENSSEGYKAFLDSNNMSYKGLFDTENNDIMPSNTNTKDIHADTEKDNKTDTTKARPSEIENGSNTDDNFIHSHKGDNPQGNNERTQSIERDNRASNGNGWQSETMAQKGEENANGERGIRDNSSQSGNDTKGADDSSYTQQGHNVGGRPKNDAKNGYKQGGEHDVPKSRDRLHRNVSLKKKDSIDSKTTQATNKQDLDSKDIESKTQALTDKQMESNTNRQADLKDLQAKVLAVLKKDFVIDDESFMPIGHIKKNEILDETNIYKRILNLDTYNKDGFIVSVNDDNGLLEAIDLNGFKLGELYNNTSKHNFMFRKAEVDLKELELEGFNSFIKNGKTQTIDKALKLAKSKASKKPYINPHSDKLEFISKKNKDTSKDNVEFITINTSYGKYIEPISGAMLEPKIMMQKDSQEIKQAITNFLNGNQKALYLVKNGFIDEANLSPFQKQILKDIINEGQEKELEAKALQNFTESNATQTESKTTREIIKEAKDKGLSVKETKELVAKNKQKTKLDNAINTDKDKQKPQENDLIDEANKAYKNEPQSDKEIDNIKSTSNPAGILNPEETATLNKEFRLKELEDLKGEKALYNANIQSLELLDNILKSGRIASDDEKQILSNFRGFGKASVELSKIIKEDGKRLEKLNNLLESLSKHLNKEVKATDLYLRANDAYYTPTPIIESMVKLAKDLGLKEDHYILEPSCGSGRFLGQFNSNQKVAGIELDPLTAKLAKTIYPYYRIDNAGFEKSKYAINNAYDLVIGNPPYGNFTIRDDSISASAHNYFMQKGIDMLSEGGISIQIVTKSFMDSDNLATNKSKQQIYAIYEISLNR